MATEPLTHVVGQLRRAALADAGLTDGQLLDAYIARRDEAAFECLVWRHGPAVLGACRRFLGHEADAEDAFQATFLVLVRKAHSVRPRGAVGAWLYGVACNVARKSRADSVRRRARELAAAPAPATSPADPDLGPAIDLEVSRLPEKYRVPVVLCELEGQPIADAARQLGWPQGTVASRLARGRDLLARRLARHGLSLAGVSATALSTDAVAGVLSAARGSSPAAHQLANAVVHAMSLTRWKTMAIAIGCVAIVLAGGLALRMSAGEAGEAPKAGPSPKAEPAPPQPPKAAAPTLIGRWRIIHDHPFRTLEFREQPGQGLMIAEKANLDADWFSWVIDDTKNPKEIDLYARVEGASNPNYGIYKFDGDRLVIYLGAPLQYQGDPGKHTRPTSFDVEGKTGERYLVLEREAVAWGEPRNDGLQFGLLAEPNGRTTAHHGEAVTFRMFVRNTTNKAIDIDLETTNARREAWVQIHVWVPTLRDAKGTLAQTVRPADQLERPVPPTRVKARLLDYRVADLGTMTVRFRPPDDNKRETTIFQARTEPGVHTVRFESEKIVTGDVKLTVHPAVAMGKAVNGLQFGLALGKDQSPRIHVGERARFRVVARNSSHKEVAFGHLNAIHLPLYSRFDFTRGGAEPLEVRYLRGPRINPPPAGTKVKPGETIDIPGEFTVPFLAHAAEGDTHVVGRTGPWRMSITQLDSWVFGAGRNLSTGELSIEIVDGDRPHTDSQRIAWGAVVTAAEPSKLIEGPTGLGTGLQFGLRVEKDDYRIGDTVKFTVLARNMTNAEITFGLPTLAGWWKNGHPVIRDAVGKELKAHIVPPTGPIGPQAMTKHTLKPGEMTELTTVSWPFVAPMERLPKDRDHVVLEKPGTYTFQYPDLHVPGSKWPWPTGALSLTFK